MSTFKSDTPDASFMSESRDWPEKLDPIVEEFSACFDSMERYEASISICERKPLATTSGGMGRETRFTAASPAHMFPALLTVMEILFSGAGRTLR